MEKLKETFKKERAYWDTEKAALAKKAEDAEAALKLVVEELTSLKWQINAMTSVVFGKRPHLTFFKSSFPYQLLVYSCLQCHRDPHYPSGL